MNGVMLQIDNKIVDILIKMRIRNGNKKTKSVNTITLCQCFLTTKILLLQILFITFYNKNLQNAIG